MVPAPGGFLYFTANRLHRQPRYCYGPELRQPLDALFRFPVAAQPVRLQPVRLG